MLCDWHDLVICSWLVIGLYVDKSFFRMIKLVCGLLIFNRFRLDFNVMFV